MTVTQDSIPYLLLETLTRRLGAAGIEQPEARAATQAERWHRTGRNNNGLALSEASRKLIAASRPAEELRESSVALTYDGARAVTDAAQHRMTVAAGLIEALGARNSAVERRTMESALQLLDGGRPRVSVVNKGTIAAVRARLEEAQRIDSALVEALGLVQKKSAGQVHCPQCAQLRSASKACPNCGHPPVMVKSPTLLTDEREETDAISDDSGTGETMDFVTEAAAPPAPGKPKPKPKPVKQGGMGAAPAPAAAGSSSPTTDAQDKPAPPVAPRTVSEQEQPDDDAAPAAPPSQVIEQGAGMNGQPDPVVKDMQGRLSQMGYQLDQDGQFGMLTKEAITRFQMDHGVPAHGKVDAVTVAAMRSPAAKAKGYQPGSEQVQPGSEGKAKPAKKSKSAATAAVEDAAAKPGGPMVRRGDGMGPGSEPDQGVSKLQAQLAQLGFEVGGAGSDGRFGGDTQKAVEALQQKYGLRVDGVVGSQTAALIARLTKAKKGSGGDHLQHAAPTEEPEEGQQMIDEGMFEEVRHPRGRGGKWAPLPGASEVMVHPDGRVAHMFVAGSTEPARVTIVHPNGSRTDRTFQPTSMSKASEIAGDTLDSAGFVEPPDDDERTKVKGLREASFSSGGFDTNMPVQQSYGGVNGLTGLTHRMVGGVPVSTGVSTVADPAHRTPGMDDFFGQETAQMPPNLRQSDPNSFTACLSCVHFDGKRLCGKYSAGVDSTLVCDTWFTLTPEDERTAARELLARTGFTLTGPVQESANTASVLRARARLEEAVSDNPEVELLAAQLSHLPRAQARQVAVGQLVAERLYEARRGIVGIGLDDALDPQIVCPGCGLMESASNDTCSDCDTALPAAVMESAEEEALLAFLTEAKDSLVKASTPQPWSTSKTSNWVARLGGLPDYIQHVSHGIKRSSPGISTSEAIAKAIGVVKRWAAGGGKVDANTKAAAAKAIAEWEALKAKQKVKRASKAEEAWVGFAPGLPGLLNLVARHVYYSGPSTPASALAEAIMVCRRAAGAGDDQAAAALTEWNRQLAIGSDHVLDALHEASVLDLPDPEVTRENAIRALQEVRLGESQFAIHFDPRLHPRTRHGEFMGVLGRMMEKKGGGEVTMPHGVIVKTRHGKLHVSLQGKKVGSFKSPEQAATSALRATGIPDAPVERHFMASFDPGSTRERLSGDEVVRRAFTPGSGAQVSKNLTAATTKHGVTLFSYKEPLAHIDHANKVALVNSHSYSASSATHRALVGRAAKAAGYEVHPIDRTEALARSGMDVNAPFVKPTAAGVKADPGTAGWEAKVGAGGRALHTRMLPSGRSEALWEVPGMEGRYTHATMTRRGTPDKVRNISQVERDRMLGGPQAGAASHTVNLISVGQHPAKPLGEFKPGDHIVYNYGISGEVTKADRKGSMVHLTTRSADGSEHTSARKATTLVGYSPHSYNGAKGDPGTYDRTGHRETGLQDALAGRPRALGGTATGYREGYDRGLTQRLMVTRRVSKGNNEGESRAMLDDLLARHSGDTLAHALAYNSFATPDAAQRFADSQGSGMKADPGTAVATQFGVFQHSSGAQGGHVVIPMDNGRAANPYHDATPVRTFETKRGAQEHADRLNGSPPPARAPRFEQPGDQQLAVPGTGMSFTVTNRPHAGGDHAAREEVGFQPNDQVVLPDGRAGSVIGGGFRRYGKNGESEVHYNVHAKVKRVDPTKAWQTTETVTAKHSELTFHPDEMAARRGRAQAIVDKVATLKPTKRPEGGVDHPVTLHAGVVPSQWQVDHGYAEWVNPAHRNPSEGDRVRVMPTHPEHAGKVGVVVQSRSPMWKAGVVDGSASGPGSQVQPLVRLDGVKEPVAIKSNEFLLPESQQPWARLNQGTDVERMIFHHMAGRPAPANPVPGSKAHAQWSYGMAQPRQGKGRGAVQVPTYTKRPGNKKDRESLLRTLAEALLARESGDTATFDRLLIEAESLLVTLPYLSLQEAERGSRQLKDMVEDAVRLNPRLRSDPVTARLLECQDAVLHRVVLAEWLVRHGEKVGPARRELAAMLPPIEESRAKLQEARTAGSTAQARLYETLIAAVS